MTVKVLLDVDGVLNDWTTRPPKEYFKTFKAKNGYEINFDPEIVARLNALDQEGVIEIIWLTTWQNLANEFLTEELGFHREFEVLYEGDTITEPYKFSQRRPWWKFWHAKKQAETGDKIVWIDDDINGERAYSENFKTWEDAHDNVLTISPDPCLTHEDLDRLEEFARE